MASSLLFPVEGGQSPDRPLIAYAFLAQASVIQGDLFSGLAPIFRPLIKGHAGEKFDARTFIDEVRKQYGLNIHPWAADDFAPRLERAGLLIKRQFSESASEYVYAAIEGEIVDVTEGEIQHVVTKFITFAAPTLSRYGLAVDEKALEDAFFAQLVSMDFMAILVKPDRTKLDEKPASTISLPKPKEQEQWEEDVSAKSKVNVLCAAFIVDCYINDRPLYDFLVRITSGALIAEVILNVQNPGETVSLEGLKIVLDGPFLMSLLDVSSEESHKYAAALIAKLREKGASIVTFRHSADEVRDNLKAVINGVRGGGGYGATARRLGSQSFAAYVTSVARDIAAALRDQSILIIDGPTTTAAYQYFSDKEEADFYKALGSFLNLVAQERDAASLAGVMRLRRNIRVPMSQFPRAAYVFVTENAWIADCARRFVEHRKFCSAEEVPPVVTDRYLAGLAWVLFGGGEAGDLPKYRLLASCTTALEGRRDVVNKMHRFLSELDENKARRFRAIMTVERAGQHLMQLTLGDSLLIRSTDDAQSILQQIEESLGEKYQRDFEEKLREHEEEHERALAEGIARQQELTSEHEKALAASAARQEELANTVLDAEAQVLKERNRVRQTEIERETLAEKLLQERLNSLEKTRTLVQRSVRLANRCVRNEYLKFSLFIVVLTIVAALLTSEFIGKGQGIIWLIGVLLAGIVSAVGFGKVPDIVFGEHFENVRKREFSKSLEELEVRESLELFEIDWTAGTVQISGKSVDAKSLRADDQKLG